MISRGHLQSMTAEGNHSLVTDEFDVIAAVSDEESIVMPGTTASAGRAAAAYDVVQMSLRVAALATTAEAAAATTAERAEGITALYKECKHVHLRGNA